jgi:integrase/recombinase XerD
MTVMRDAVADYLMIRRALGFKLREHEWALESFVSFLERTGASTITTELALAWASDTRGTEGWKAARLSMVRGFAVYLRTIDPATEVPPTGLLLHRKRYAIPYLFSEEEISRLLAAAAALSPYRRATLHGTLIGLLAVTGMRISEALGLDCDDIDLDAGVLTIRNTKFGKSRQLPLHQSTVEALARYERHRAGLWPRPWTQSFFVSARGNRPDKSNIEHVFRKLCRHAGLEGPRGSPRPTRKCSRPRPVYSAVADPIVIAHVLGEQGQRICDAPDAPMSVDLTVEVAARGHWDGTSVVLCGTCRSALRRDPPSTLTANARVAVGAAS